MPAYRVSWEIDLEGDSPEDVAKQALAIQRDPNSWATCFSVTDDKGKTTVDFLMSPDYAEWKRSLS